MARTILVVLATSMASSTAVSLILVMTQTPSLVVDGMEVASSTAVSVILVTVQTTSLVMVMTIMDMASSTAVALIRVTVQISLSPRDSFLTRVMSF
jgi:hypothetical protein